MTKLTSEQKKRFIHIIILTAGLILAASAYSILAKHGISIPCIINKLTGFIIPGGILCPGCGNTRAAISLLRGDISGAFSYNALFAVEFFYLFLVYAVSAKNYIKNKRFFYEPPFIAVDIIILVAVSLWGIVRNVLQFM